MVCYKGILLLKESRTLTLQARAWTMASKPPSGASKLPEISAFSTSALNFSVFVVSVIWCLKPYGSAHGSGQGDFCLSVLGSMNGISFLSTNEPNPSRKFFVMVRILSAERGVGGRRGKGAPTQEISELGEFLLVVLHGIGEVHQVVQVDGVVHRLPVGHGELDAGLWDNNHGQEGNILGRISTNISWGLIWVASSSFSTSPWFVRGASFSTVNSVCGFSIYEAGQPCSRSRSGLSHRAYGFFWSNNWASIRSGMSGKNLREIHTRHRNRGVGYRHCRCNYLGKGNNTGNL